LPERRATNRAFKLFRRAAFARKRFQWCKSLKPLLDIREQFRHVCIDTLSAAVVAPSLARAGMPAIVTAVVFVLSASRPRSLRSAAFPGASNFGRIFFTLPLWPTISRAGARVHDLGWFARGNSVSAEIENVRLAVRPDLIGNGLAVRVGPKKTFFPRLSRSAPSDFARIPAAAGLALRI
jgi:hypothetical protein